MEIRIKWSGLSERQLKDIFDYYSLEASPGIAKKMNNQILERVSILKNNPLAGVKEELLSEYPFEFIYLIESNYKIIYWKKGNLITIASVFDCRQNPEKIKTL